MGERDQGRCWWNLRLSLNQGFCVPPLCTGIDKSVRKGAQHITVDVELESAGTSQEDLQDLVKALGATSPIRDTLANPVKVTTTLI
ncbi:OsmC family protein [Paenarthrobacter nitroguajacolicus]